MLRSHMVMKSNTSCMVPWKLDGTLPAPAQVSSDSDRFVNGPLCAALGE
jgi:hypothetical protein